MMRMAERVFALILSLALPGVASGVGEGAVSVPVGTTGTNGASKLPEVTITATRLSIDPFEQPYAIYRLNRTELDDGVGRTLLDRADYAPGVVIQHTGPGQTSPYIRGLTGKQSLLLLDGVRLSHATMRGGPNQYSALIPDMSVDSIDILLGSSGVVNGSDGLTGALDFRLAPAGRGITDPASPWMSTRVDTANGVQAQCGVDGQFGAFRYSAEASYDCFHDRVGGKDAAHNLFGTAKRSDSIPNTAYNQSAVAVRAAYDGFENRSIEVAFGQTMQEDAPRPDGYYANSGDPKRISRYYDPESFTYLHLRDRWTPDGLFFDRLVTTTWWHQQDEDQVREDLTGSTPKYRRREYHDRIDSFGIEPQFTSFIGRHELTYGALALYERTGNDYREYRNPSGTSAAGATPYKPADWHQYTTITDGAEYNTYAVYAQDLWRMTDAWSLLGGLRYTYVNWAFDVASGNASDWTYSLRASWQFRKDMLVFAGVSENFRAPNLNDLDGASDRASSGTIDFGNPDLDPEKGFTYEVGWRFEDGRDKLGASAFYTVLTDVIQTVYPSGGGAGKAANGDCAYLRGFELEWDYGLPAPAWFGERLALIGNLSDVSSRQEVSLAGGGTTTQPISRANRLYGLVGLRQEIDRNWWTKVQVRFSDRYSRDDITPEDATDVRLTVPGDANGTVPGYAVVDLSVGWRSNDRRRWASASIENVADMTYRQLGSGEDAPGLNFVFAGGVRF